MAADNNIFIRIKGEADLVDAQAQIRELTDRNKELEAEIRRLEKAEKDDIAAVKARIAAGKESQSELQAVINYHKELKNEVLKGIDANKRNVQSLKQSVNQYNAVQGAGVRLRTQLMAMTEELKRMAVNGDITSAAFMKMAEQAANLTDTTGDVQQIINILASDTGKLDTALQVGGGLAGAFNAATSAAALLGGESEKLQDAFLKVQAALSVLNGLQQVAAVLDKRSAANVKIRLALAKLFNTEKTKEAVTTTASTAATKAHSAAMRADAAATTTATVATKGFTKALLANPVGAILAAVVALGAGLYALGKAIFSTKKEEDAFNESMKVSNDRVEALTRGLDEMKRKHSQELELLRAKGATEKELHDETLSQQEQQKVEAQKILNEQTDAYNKAVETRKEIDERYDKWWRRDKKKNQMLENMGLTDEGLNEMETKLNELQNMVEGYVHNIDVETETWRTKQKEEREKALKEETERLMQHAKDVATVQQVLRNINDTQGSYDDDGVYWTNKEKALLGLRDAAKETAQALKELREEEESVSVASYESFLDMKLAGMELEGKTDQEMWDYKYQNMMRYLEKKKQSLEEQLGSEAAFSQEMVDINTQMTDLQIENNRRVQQSEQEKLAETINIATEALGTLSDIMSEVFGAISDHIQTQMDDLNEMYTTDAEEAREDANKKYISEKELANKQLALKRKQAAIDKASSLFTIGLNTAIAIMQAIAQFGPPPSPGGIAGIASAAAIGTTQLAIAAAKPLPKYEKGRKGGKGEYALVGERGPELMYVPAGASIVPNNKMGNMDMWSQYGVPKLNIPASAASDMITASMMMQAATFDYDRLGKAVAANMPQQKAVSVNVDRSGVTISSDGNRRTYMNQKYSAAW